MEDLLERAKELNLMLYQRCLEADIALFKWWTHLNQTGDFDDLFEDTQRSLSAFYDIFKPPCFLILAFDGDHIWNAIWFSPFSDSNTAAFVGNWCDEPFRGSRRQLAVNIFAYDAAFKFWDVLLGVTKHENLLGIHRKMGYEIVGSIPHFMAGDEAWIVYLTKENFCNSRVYKIGEKL